MFKGVLYPAQKPAAEMLVNKRRVLLTWEQGTGKTVIALAAAEKLFDLGKAKHALIIGRSADYWQWEDKILEWTTSGVILAQAKKKDTRTYRPGECRYTICSYSLFRRDYSVISGFPWDIVVADEAQEFKNHKSKTAQLIKRLNTKIKPKYRWALTGTSISNHLEELYSIFYWVDRGFLPPWPQFEEDHIIRDSLGQIESYKNLKGLNEYLKARMDRKTHADLKGQLPRLVEQIHKVPKSKAYIREEAHLLSALNRMAANLEFDTEGNVKSVRKDSRVAKAFHKARQELISEEKLSYARELTDSILSENINNKLVIFSFYKRPLYKLQHDYGKLATTFTGDDKHDHKRDHISEFATGKARILLASNAGSTGLDLKWANYIIHLDIPFSHGILDQRNKRITRVGSDHATAVVIYLIMQDSIEEFYYQVVKNKKKLADAVQEGASDNVIIRPESLRHFISDN